MRRATVWPRTMPGSKARRLAAASLSYVAGDYEHRVLSVVEQKKLVCEKTRRENKAAPEDHLLRPGELVAVAAQKGSDT